MAALQALRGPFDLSTTAREVGPTACRDNGPVHARPYWKSRSLRAPALFPPQLPFSAKDLENHDARWASNSDGTKVSCLRSRASDCSCHLSADLMDPCPRRPTLGRPSPIDLPFERRLSGTPRPAAPASTEISAPDGTGSSTNPSVCSGAPASKHFLRHDRRTDPAPFGGQRGETAASSRILAGGSAS